jgi:hypothetical protein
LVVIALVALAEGAGVPMEIAQNSTKQPEHIPLLGFPATTTATTATKVVLEITHVVTAALIISAIAAHPPPRRG